MVGMIFQDEVWSQSLFEIGFFDLGKNNFTPFLVYHGTKKWKILICIFQATMRCWIGICELAGECNFWKIK